MSAVPVLSDDEKHLASLRHKQELNRSWSGLSNFAISFSIISILAGCFTSFDLGWNNGGPAAIAWGWPIVAAFILILFWICWHISVKKWFTGPVSTVDVAPTDTTPKDMRATRP
jgi:hypothetical protein